MMTVREFLICISEHYKAEMKDGEVELVEMDDISEV